jgi:hypothetical protein
MPTIPSLTFVCTIIKVIF